MTANVRPKKATLIADISPVSVVNCEGKTLVFFIKIYFFIFSVLYKTLKKLSYLRCKYTNIFSIFVLLWQQKADLQKDHRTRMEASR